MAEHKKGAGHIHLNASVPASNVHVDDAGNLVIKDKQLAQKVKDHLSKSGHAAPMGALILCCDLDTAH